MLTLAKRLKRVEMPKLPVETRVKSFDEVVLGYSEEQVVEEASRCLQCKEPGCTSMCPVGQNPKKYVGLVAEGRFEEAMEAIIDRNPLPGVCGRVCTHPCEDGCVLGKKGDPVAIAWVKRFVADHVKPELEKRGETGKSVAVVGSGPAGLAAAFDLAKMGHSVTIYERNPVFGGMLTVGIPAFRLPREVVERDVAQIEKLGVKIRLNTCVGDEIPLENLLEEYDAVFLGIGAHEPKWMGIPGEELGGVEHVLTFLREVNLSGSVDIGPRVGVVGGGSAAIDAVRTSLRLGADPFIIYRRTRREMPADPVEVVEAEEEGIPFNFLTNPVKILGEAGRVTGVECVRMELGDVDQSGRPRPVPVEGSEHVMPLDTLIEAISQKPDLRMFEKVKDLRVNKWGLIEVDEKYCTSIKGVFSAGDVVTGPKTVAEAIKGGKEAAKHIHKYLVG